jgi:subtilisin family serine protease
MNDKNIPGIPQVARRGARKWGALWGLALLALAILPMSMVRGSGGDDEQEFEDDEAIVRVVAGTDLGKLNRDYQTLTLQRLGTDTVYRLQTPPGVRPDTVVSQLQIDPRVRWAITNYWSRRPETRQQWTSVFDGGEDPKAWVNQYAFRQAGLGNAQRYSQGVGVTVAVLDTGIALKHPALVKKLVPGWDALAQRPGGNDVPNRRDDDGNGYVDEATGHGTMVAGIISRIAPQAKLMPVKVLDSDGVGDTWALVEGMRWALDHGAKVLNISLAIPKKCEMLGEVIREAYDRGAIIVTSAGNVNDDVRQFPAKMSEVLTVAALTETNRKADFSNYDSVVDTAAPGVGILSTNWNGRFAVWSGTSFAAPFVAGEVALVWSRYPLKGNEPIQRAVIDSCKNIDSLNRSYQGKLGKGLINIEKAVMTPPKS